MATIENRGFTSRKLFIAELRKMDDAGLAAQQLVQQGAVNAVSYLLKHGCTPDMAERMLASLRENAQILRAEAERRGGSLFAEDQTGFD